MPQILDGKKIAQKLKDELKIEIENQIKIIKSELDQAFKFAKNSKFPAKKYIKKFIYA